MLFDCVFVAWFNLKSNNEASGNTVSRSKWAEKERDKSELPTALAVKDVHGDQTHLSI